MKTILPKLLTLTALVISIVFFNSCSKDHDNVTPSGGDNEFMFMATFGSTWRTYVVSDLENGTVDKTQGVDAQNVTPLRLKDLDPDGYYFLRDNDNKKLMKCKTENGIIVEKQSLPLNDLFPYNNVRLDDNRILFMSTEFTPSLRYMVVNTTTMTIEKQDEWDLVKAPRSTMDGFLQKSGNKLYLGYLDANSDTYADTAVQVAIINASTFAVEDTTKDFRSASAGMPTMRYSSFIDEAGDLYFITTPSNFWGANAEKPSAIMRIKSGATETDRSYFFDLSTLLGEGNHVTGSLLYLGDGKIIFRRIQEDLIVEYSDYGPEAATFPIDVWVADLKTKTATKLDVPAGRDANCDFLAINNGKVAIITNAVDGCSFYIYDPAAGSVKQGLKVSGASSIAGYGVLKIK